MNRRGMPFMLLTPSGVVFAVSFLAPVGFFLVVSFWRVRSYQLQPDATFENYVTALDRYGFSLLYTLFLAAIIATSVTVFGFGFAYLCRFKAKRLGPLLLFVAMLTLFGGYLTKIYMWRTILGETGILNATLQYLGVIGEPIRAFLFNPVAVVITLSHYLLPFAILPLYGALHAIGDLPLEAARDLGAGGWRRFRDVVLPQCRVGVFTAFTLTFLFAAGDYATARLVGGPDTSLIGVFIQSQFTQRLNQPLGSALAFTIVGSCLAGVAVVWWALNRTMRYR